MSPPPLSPADLMLIALLPHPDDMARASAGWYRLPESAAPDALYQAKALALYQPRSFGAEGLQIAWWGRIEGITRTTRRELLPDQPGHPRADEPYLRVALAPLVALETPLRAEKARRLLFAPVLWGALRAAPSLDALFRPAPRPIVDSLLYQLVRQQLDTIEDDSPQRLFEEEETLMPDW